MRHEPLLEDGQDARPVAARRRSPQPRVARSRPPAPGCRRRPRRARRRGCTASSSRSITWGKASRKKPLMRRVTSTRGRPSSASGMTSRPVTRWLSLVPHGPDAEQGQRLGDVVARRCAWRPCPTARARRCVGTVPGLGDVALDEPVGQRPADLPRQRRRDRLRVDRVEVAAGRQHVGAAPARRAARARRARGGRRARRAGWRSRRSCGAGSGTSGRRPSAASGRRRRSGAPSPRAASASTSAPALGLDPVDRRPRARAVEVDRRGRSATVARSDGTAPCGSRVIGEHGVDQLRRRPGAGRARAGRRGSGRPSARRGSRRRGRSTSSNTPSSGSASPSSRSRWISASTSRSHTWVPQRRQLGRVHGLAPARRCRAAARGGRGRRRCRPGSAAAAGGRRRRRGCVAWPARPRPGR